MRGSTTADDLTTREAIPSDLRMARTLWPVLLSSAVGLVPFTVFSTFLVPIAADAGTSAATMGSLRGLGGIAALIVGTALAPFIDRIPKQLAAATALVLLGLSCVLGAVGTLATFAAFCLLIGAATAMLNPALGAAAADQYGTGAAAGRAATLVTATQSLTAMLAAPLIALPALWWGWEGDLLAVASVAGLLAVVLLRRRTHRALLDSEPSVRPSYLASFRALAGTRGAVPLLAVGGFRTAAFMGYLAYLAAFYDDRFDLTPSVFALVWTLSGTSFFLGNLLTGRLINRASRLPVERVLLVGASCSLVAILGFYAAPTLPLALGCTALLGASHAAVAACVVSLLVRRCDTVRGAALSVNAAGQSLGVFVGAAVGGLGLGLGGYVGIAIGFGAISAAAVAAAVAVLRSTPSAGAEPCG
ncbi:MFS transporter [Actinopolymorpha sp. B9G3]|uniref:MFS transporter n=1 Tax=Actinopolymorpha sp. B9G3 TaxID=3158970 RepID=UPI0032D91115